MILQNPWPSGVHCCPLQAPVLLLLNGVSWPHRSVLGTTEAVEQRLRPIAVRPEPHSGTVQEGPGAEPAPG